MELKLSPLFVEEFGTQGIEFIKENFAKHVDNKLALTNYLASNEGFIDRVGGVVQDVKLEVMCDIDKALKKCWTMISELCYDLENVLVEKGVEAFRSNCIRNIVLNNLHYNFIDFQRVMGRLANDNFTKANGVEISSYDNSLVFKIDTRKKTSRIFNDYLKQVNAYIVKMFTYNDFDTELRELISKEVNKAYNVGFASISDMLQNKVHKYTSVLTSNLNAYLLMSEGHNWTSCHALDGSYNMGNINYALDRNTLIWNLYTSDTTDFMNGVDFHDMVARAVVHINETGFVVGRLYPSERDGGVFKDLRKIVESQVHQLWRTMYNIEGNSVVVIEGDSKNEYVGRPKQGVRYIKNFGGYTDLTKYDFNYKIYSNSEYELDLLIGGTAKWEGEELGSHLNGINEVLESNSYPCDCCGEHHDCDDMTYYDGCYYCNDCIVYCELEGIYAPTNLCTYSEYHQAYFTESYVNDNMCYVDSINDYVIWNDCSYCEMHGEYYLNDRVTYIEYLDDYIPTDDCVKVKGKWYYNCDVTKDDNGDYYFNGELLV